MSKIPCHEDSCPFAFTDKSEQAQNYGCLPTPYEIINMRVNHNKTWACHAHPDVPCVGAMLYLKEEGLSHSPIYPLVTEKDDWSIYSNETNT